MDDDRLKKQIAFIEEIDGLKKICRKTLLMDGTRCENDAEHSWHLAVMAMLLCEYSAQHIDLLRVMKMVLIHDIVEIDAGDTYCYDCEGNVDKREREEKAAERLFSILPADQAAELRALWEEFEECKTPEARFAASLDRFQPLLHNYRTQGRSWKEHRITKDMVLDRNSLISKGAPQLWGYVGKILEDSVKRKYLGE
jgi:putative hydrolase of HD superfamily